MKDNIQTKIKVLILIIAILSLFSLLVYNVGKGDCGCGNVEWKAYTVETFEWQPRAKVLVKVDKAFKAGDTVRIIKDNREHDYQLIEKLKP